MSLKARYKLNGNVQEIGGTLVGNINTECMNVEYSKEIADNLTNINVFTSSNYITTIESGYVYVYNQKGTCIWNTKTDNTNSFNIDIKQKQYNNILTVKTDKNSVAIVYYSTTVTTNKYNVFCDVYSIFGNLLSDCALVVSDLDEKPNVSLYMSENYLYIVTDNKNNNSIRVVDKHSKEDCANITLDIESTIKAKPFYIRDFIYNDGYWYSLIESNSKFFIQKNYQSGSYHDDFIQLKKSNRNIPIILYKIVGTDDNLVFFSNNLLYTVDKETLSNITLIKTFDNNIRLVKVNERADKICIVAEHEYLPEGVTTSYYMNTDVYVMDYNFVFDSANQTRYNSSDIVIDNEDYIYTNSGNKLTKYKAALLFTNEGVIADKCVKFNGGNSRIEIENPFYDKTTKEPIDLTNTGFSVSLWYKPNTFDWSQQVLLGGIVLPEWKDLQYCSYWNKFFMVAENVNMLAVGGYEPDDKNVVWRAYNITGLEYNIHSFIWVEDIRRFIAVGKDSNQYYVSENGLEWKTYYLDESVSLNAVKYIKELKTIFFIGYKYLGYSDNFYIEPENIMSVENVPEFNLIDIEYNNGIYSLIADDSLNIYTNSNQLNSKWDSQNLGIQNELLSLNTAYYKTDKTTFATVNGGQYIYILSSIDNRYVSLTLPEKYDEILKAKVINDKIHILPNDKNYCLTLNDDGTWNTTDIVFGDNNVADDIDEGILYTEYDYDSELENVIWKTPIKYTIASVDEANYVLCKDESVTSFYKTYFVNAKRLNIWENFTGTWESYSNQITETWKTLSLHDKSTNIITDFALVIGYNRHLYLVYDNQKFKSDFIFDGSKLGNWYNIVVVADGINHKFTLYINDEEYNTFEYDPNGNLKITSPTITLGDINKHTGSVRRAEIWIDFANTWNSSEYSGKSWNTIGRDSFWDYNYYNLYGCMNDLRIFDHQLTTEEIHDIRKINVGTYIGQINNTTYPTDSSEFSNDLSTDSLFCINKDWSVSFKYKKSSVVDNIVFSKGDDEGGIIFGYFDPNTEIQDKALWENTYRVWDYISETWRELKPYRSVISSYDSSLYLLIYDKRNNKDFREVDLIKEGYKFGNIKYDDNTEIGYIKAQSEDETLYNTVKYKFNSIKIGEEHKYSFSYNYRDRLVKFFFDGELIFRLFNLEFNNSNLKFDFGEHSDFYTLSDLKIYHSCLSETEMKNL